MYEKEYAIKIKEKVNESKKPILVEDTVDYIMGYEKLKYYYSNELIKHKHIGIMEQDKYCKYDKESSLYDTLYTNLYEENSSIKVLIGVFYKEMNPFLHD